MNRRLRQFISGFLLVCVLALAAPFSGMESWASSGKISFSDPSAMVGNQVTVNVKVTATEGALGGADIMLAYDPSVLEFVSGTNANGGAGSIRLIGTMDSDNTTSFSYTLTFKTLQAGNTGITVANYEGYDKDLQAMTMSHVGSSSVKVTPLATYSSEAALSSLQISPGELTPAFSPDVTSYTANVAGDVDKIAVSAAPKDSKAKVVINGSSDLKVGENTVVCKVTAEDGQTVKNYTITVTKAEGPLEPEAPVVGDLTATVGDQQLSVASAFDETLLPEGFEASTVMYGGTEVMAGKGIEKDLTLIYLVGADGSGDFYIYNESTGSCSPYVSIHVTEKSVVILAPDDTVVIPEGFAESTIELEGRQVTGWVWASDPEQRYCVFYGMNWNGEKGLYRYDIGEKTIQRYFEDPQAAGTYSEEQYVQVAQQYNDLLEDYDLRFKVIIGLIALCLLFLFLFINTLLRKGEHGHDGRDYDDRGGRGGREPRDGRSARAGQGGRDSSGDRGKKKETRRSRDDGYEAEDTDERSEEEYRARQYRGPEHRDAERYMRGEEPDDDFEEFEDLDDLAGGPQEDPYKRRPAREAAAAKADDDFEFIDLD